MSDNAAVHFPHYYEFKQTIVVEKTKTNMFLDCVPHV